MVKDGPFLITYRDGIPTAGSRITGAPDLDLPLYFGGQGLENWRGYLSDVRLFSTALSDSQIAALVPDRTLPTPRFDITGVTMDAARRVTLSWPTSPGLIYSVWATTNLTNWVEVVNSLSTGSYIVQPGGNPNSATGKRVYYQIRAYRVP